MHKSASLIGKKLSNLIANTKGQVYADSFLCYNFYNRWNYCYVNVTRWFIMRILAKIMLFLTSNILKFIDRLEVEMNKLRKEKR